MKRSLSALLATTLALLLAPPAFADEETLGGSDARGRMMMESSPQLTTPMRERIIKATEVYKALISDREQVNREVIDNAQCVAVFPRVTKAAFVVGGHYGKGIVTCKTSGNQWSKLAWMELSGGSIGLQAGYVSSELVLFISNKNAAQAIQNGSFTFGTDASAAAGAYGTSAKSFGRRVNEAVAYTRGGGAFAGLSLTGTSINPDQGTNRIFYGDEGVSTTLTTPAEPGVDEVDQFLSALPS